MQSVRPAGVAPRLRVSLAAAQLAVIAGMLWFLFTGEFDSTATTVDTTFVALAIAMPLTLAASYWAGRSLQKGSSQTEPRVTRYFARIAQGATLVLLVPTLLIAPLALFGAIFLRTHWLSFDRSRSLMAE